MNTDEIKYPFFNKTSAKFPFLPTISHFISQPFIFKPLPALRTSTPLFSHFSPFFLLPSLTSFISLFSLLSDFCFHFLSLLLPLTSLFPFTPCFSAIARRTVTTRRTAIVRSRTNAHSRHRSSSSICCIYHADSPLLMFSKIVTDVTTFYIRHANNYPNPNHHGRA